MVGLKISMKIRLALTPLQKLTLFPGTSFKQQLGRPTAYSIGWVTLAACTTYSSWSFSCFLILIKATSKQAYFSPACFDSFQAWIKNQTSKSMTRSNQSSSILSRRWLQGAVREFKEWASSFTASALDPNWGKTIVWSLTRPQRK